MTLPWFKKGDSYYDVLKKKLFLLTEGGESVFATYKYSSVAAGDESDWTRMDTNATDLETEKEYLFFQWFTGVLREGLIYEQYPIGEQVWNTDKLVPNTAQGDEYSNIDFKVSPYNDPNECTEFWVVKGVSIGFKYFNNQAFPILQKLKWVGKKFKQVEIVVDQPHPVTGQTVTSAIFAEMLKEARPLYMRRIA